jgi:tRNA (mo5U34)-methyltransferase
MPSAEELQAQADAILWFHSIDLGQGVRTKGLSELVLRADQLPDFAGKSVLDVGTWDGYYAYEAERQGARRVVALDHYAWGVDFGARGAYWSQCIAEGTLPDHRRDATDFWREDLPGRRGFDFAHHALDSKVEPVLADFMTVDLESLGTFDVVLYLGVLYHMKEPLTALERVRQITTQVAVIETEAVQLQSRGDAVLLEFYAGSDVGVDFGNWFIPTLSALQALCRAAGFAKIEVVQGPPAQPRRRRPFGPAPPPRRPYRAVVHAFV